tara:strand:- start:858 stop:2741 length:1884 start_codon:yes stop_codon:yes gene_type:complete
MAKQIKKDRDIRYINKDFSQFRQTLIDYSKTYFPTTFTDFSPSSPGMMFMEQAAYVGDVLSFYTDTQIQETFLQYAKQQNNLYELAYMFGYKPRATSAAQVSVDFYQQVPAIPSGSGADATFIPDFNYALVINPGTVIQSTLSGSSPFLVQDKIDFSYSSSSDPTTVSIYTIAAGSPTYFLLKKSRNAISATQQTTYFTFNDPVEFATVEIVANNIIGIQSILDSDGYEWNEVDYLAQDTIYSSIANTNVNDPNNSVNSNDAPYLLQLKQVQRRFVTRFPNSSSLQIQFGAGNTSDTDEVIVPNPDNVGLGLPFEIDKLTTAYSPTNFIFNNTYGIAPSNTTITASYLTGGGVSSNVDANTLNQINVISTNFNNINNIVASKANIVRNSLVVNNPLAATGGGTGDSTLQIRENSISNFATQLRNVTLDDYTVRSLSLPSQFGTIAKTYVTKPTIQNSMVGEIGSLDFYVLSYDREKNLRIASNALKNNLKTYLSQHRMIGDSINVKDAFIINISLSFDVIVLPNYNNNDVLLTCINALTDYFNIDKWQINQPIILRDLYVLLDLIEGVQTIKDIQIENQVGQQNGYSAYSYDLDGALLDNVYYPSIDPMIFELRYPETNIKGRVVSL